MLNWAGCVMLDTPMRTLPLGRIRIRSVLEVPKMMGCPGVWWVMSKSVSTVASQPRKLKGGSPPGKPGLFWSTEVCATAWGTTAGKEMSARTIRYFLILFNFDDSIMVCGFVGFYPQRVNPLWQPGQIDGAVI